MTNKISKYIIYLYKNRLIILSVLFIVGSLYYRYKKNKDEQFLLEHGKYTTARVIKVIHHKGTSIKYKYVVNNLIYENWSNTVEDHFSINDSVKIQYYIDNPQISKVIDDE